MNNKTVAPYVGAWIETETKRRGFRGNPVAPYVGAWIETVMTIYRISNALSHPTWVRGLKLGDVQVICITISRTLRGCVD